MRLTSSKVASVDLVMLGPPSQMPKVTTSLLRLRWTGVGDLGVLGYQCTRANGSTDVWLGDPLGAEVPFLVGLGELNGPRCPGQGQEQVGRSLQT